MVYYYCAQCGQTLMPGLQMCQKCGQVFQHAVPDADEGGENRTEYWPPRAPTAQEQAIRQVGSKWEGANPASKASIFGIIAIFLICFVVARQVIYTRSLAQSLPHSDTTAYNAATPSQMPQRYPQSAYQSQQIPQPAPVRLAAKVETGTRDFTIGPGLRIFVTNENDFAWANVRVTINPNGNLPFSAQSGQVEAGYVLNIPVSEFTTSSGLRFDENGLRVNNVQITADTPNGTGTVTVVATPESANAPQPPSIFRTPVANTPDPYGQADTTIPSPTPP